MQQETPAIALIDLTRDFPIGLRGYKLRALEKVNLSIPPKGIFGLLGPNGSGKSTAIKIILGLLKPSAGICKVFGKPAGNLESRNRIGYLPENPHFPSFLSGRELVIYFGGLSGMEKQHANERTEEVIELVGMTQSANRKIRTYSKGMLQRIGLAQALVHNPDVLVLDEPLSGLDPQGTQEVLDLLLRLKNKGKVILISSHLLTRVEEICDRVAILHRGHLLKEGKLDDLLMEKGNTHMLKVSGFPDGTTEEELHSLFQDKNLKVESIQPAKRPLDEFFLDIVQKDKEEQKS